MFQRQHYLKSPQTPGPQKSSQPCKDDPSSPQRPTMIVGYGKNRFSEEGMNTLNHLNHEIFLNEIMNKL